MPSQVSAGSQRLRSALARQTLLAAAATGRSAGHTVPPATVQTSGASQALAGSAGRHTVPTGIVQTPVVQAWQSFGLSMPLLRPHAVLQQMPSTQWPLVQALSALHVPPSGFFGWHTLAGEQKLPAVHSESSPLQPPAHTVPAHTAPPQETGVAVGQVNRAPSQFSRGVAVPLTQLAAEHCVPAGTAVFTQPVPGPVPGLQVSVLQGSPSLQFGAGPPVHVPPWHVSPVVQLLLSLQAVPFGFAGRIGHVPPLHETAV